MSTGKNEKNKLSVEDEILKDWGFNLEEVNYETVLKRWVELAKEKKKEHQSKIYKLVQDVLACDEEIAFYEKTLQERASKK